MKPGRAQCEDNAYQRHGTAGVLLAYDLDRGQRFVEVRQRRTKADSADFRQRLVTQHYAKAEQIRRVQDKLNTHSYGSFYEQLDVERAPGLKNKLDFHVTPRHGPWLNKAELERSALSRQCLDRRIESQEQLAQEVERWQQRKRSRNSILARLLIKG